MCGIVGAVMKWDTGFTMKTQGSFYDLLYCDALRGIDATGAILVERSSDFHIMKESVEAAEFIPKMKRHELDKKMWNNGKAYIGHNRKATMGKMTDASAHPFVVDDTFAMVHNGTLRMHRHLANVEVDSEALAIHLKKAVDKDTVEAWEEALGEVDGAYAIVGYDQVRHQMYFLRNKERPLTLLEADDAWYFASEGPLLTYILWRNNYTLDKLKVIEIPEHTLFTLDLEKKQLTKQVLVPKKAQPRTTNQGGSTGYSGELIASEPVTEKTFKRLKNKHLGKSLKFLCQDYVELDFPNDISKGSTQVCLFGKQKGVKFRHSITTDVDLTGMNITQMDQLVGREWTGKIESMSYKEEGQYIVVTLVDAKPTGQPVVAAQPNDLQMMEFMLKLEEMRDTELFRLSMDTQGQLKSWQLKLIRDELAIRAGVTERVLGETTITMH